MMPRDRSNRLKRSVWILHERGWSANQVAIHKHITPRRVKQILAEIRAAIAARNAVAAAHEDYESWGCE